ncbi:MAG: RDD family protein [Pseudomonadota bacterium]|nr:RDD family protein [Pseudomonadota bacterium]MED5430631.1 RDD family protein [Pseudomonadota bacterium]|tara:strand:- start:477 stop:878 length:402 start_codon:yes stop_codon:yes gene_type:complete
MNQEVFSEIGLIKRLLINTYDLLLLFSVLFFATIPLHFFTDGHAIGYENILYKIYLLGITVFYYSWFWVNHNQTLGMKAWKTLVVNNNGERKITYLQALVRLIVALLGGHIFLLFNKKSLQDTLSKTKLVTKK